jgi:hypothetical protein
VTDDFLENPDTDDSPAIQKYFNGVDPLYKDKKHLATVKKFCREFGTLNAV